ncbi:hypothetical protein GPECTOR_58g557 [Gonium pectorale]|uniref:Uncharacterized protein n=1 Tax=Gonium pectorale TaxID=33097 RepID=A0A150G5L2_GONPE|nr:hypothetical protein GPECTOR_58g557 [Gonium pectorale]|eukprot:KXZ45108.1 hypothetical protein GPECTOR_58g557 [Gonium pectorale]
MLAGSAPSAADYLQGLFENYDAARAALTGSGGFAKKSKVAVVYMCFERQKIILAALAALFKSEGLRDFDVFISQDGGSNYRVELPDEASNFNLLYIRHPANLCPGQHHYFVKSFVFDIMRYEALIVVEEDNIVHPDAIQMLYGMLRLTANDPQIGLVAVTDMDNSLLIDESKHSNGVMRAEIHQGHLWVFGMHATRYQVVRQDLRDYFNVILGKNYIMKDQPPLRDEIAALHRIKGFAENTELSQDAFFVNSLEKAGYSRRMTTMVRLFEPVGWSGLHFQSDPAVFYGVYGRGMYEGRVTEPPVEVGATKESQESLKEDCLVRLNRLYRQYLGRSADEGAAKAAVWRLLNSKLNAVELMRNVLNSAEHQRRMKSFATRGGGRVGQRSASAP